MFTTLALMLSLAAPGYQPKTPAPSAPATQAAPGPYRVLATWDIGGEGGWDIVTVDPDSGRLYVPRSTHVQVIDTTTGKVIGDIPNTEGVHAVALAMGKGFTSNGKSGDVTVFDLATLKTLQTVKAGKSPDEIVFEPTTKRVLCFNGHSSDVTLIDATSLSPVGAIELGGKPEFAAVAQGGKVFVNLEDKSELLRLDAASMKVEQRWPLAPGEEPTGLAFDAAHHHLFAACGNAKMVVLDSDTGKVLATPAIGKHADGAEFDSAGGFAIAPSGDGTLTFINAQAPFDVVQTLTTHKGARTLVQDPKTRQIYLPAADYEDAKDGQRPKMKPGTFKIVVVGPSPAKKS